MISSRIVFPCYNEARRIEPELFTGFLKAHPETSFLFVDDGSSDGTGKVLAALCESAPANQASILTLERNSGKAEAVRQGMLHAMDIGPVDAIGYMDADLSAPLEEISRLALPLETGEADIALGSRVAILGCHIDREPLRHYLGRVFATCASLTLDLPVYDTQCGAKLFRNCPELGSLFDKPFGSRWVFDVEILARLKISGGFCGRAFPAGIVEVPLKTWTHKDCSKVKPMDFFKGICDLLAIRKLLKASGQ